MSYPENQLVRAINKEGQVVTKKIKNLRAGDQVVSWDLIAQRPVTSTVIGNEVYAAGPIYRLVLADMSQFDCSSSAKFLTKEGFLDFYHDNNVLSYSNNALHDLKIMRLDLINEGRSYDLRVEGGNFLLASGAIVKSL